MAKKSSGSTGISKMARVHKGKPDRQRKIDELLRQRAAALQDGDEELAKEIAKQVRRLGGHLPRVIKRNVTVDSSVLEVVRSVGTNVGTPTQPAGRELVPDMTVSIYLDTDDAATALKVIQATQRIVNELGYETPTITAVQRGSVWTWMVAKFQSEQGRRAIDASKAKAAEIIEEAEHFARLQVQEKQAEVDEKNASSAASLMEAYADVPNVAIKIGALLFVKYKLPNGDPVVITRTLSLKEQRAYDRTPSICSEPSLLEENLARLVYDDDDQKAVGQ
ncbi:hypothetical protein AAIH25_14975 [Arthrobacter crystallopoietes]|uniref:hypothetical protein n=1 Tax=Crystallibacter crystallopoietes TaxID=37928 RepID=UPI003D25471F